MSVQLDLFAEQFASGYTPPRPFAFPSEYWERMGHAPLFRVVCGVCRRRVVFGFAAHVQVRRAYGAAAVRGER